MRRQVNLRFVAGLLLSLAVLGVGTHFLHAFQVKRNASALLRRAEEAEQEKDYDKAVDYFGRYLGFRPDDTEALIKYALLLDQQHSKYRTARVRAFLVLDQALRRAPDRADVRRRVVTAAMQLGQFSDARESLMILLESSPDDPELEDLLGRCEEGSSQFEKAAQWYVKAVHHDPHRADGYVRLAEVYRIRLERPIDADTVMEQLVKANPESVQARLARGSYLRRLGLLAAANKEISYARDKLAPGEADVLLSSADLAQVENKPDEARQYFEQGRKRYPKDLRFLLGLAGLDLRAGRRAEAAKRLRETIKLVPDQAALIWTVADLFIDAGEPTEAETLLERLTESEVSSAAVDYLRARLALGEGRVAAARDLLDKQRAELVRSPDLACQADMLLGECHERLHNPEQQLAAYRRAATGAAPSVAARLGLASALVANDQIDEAIAEYRKLVPALPALRLTLGRLLIRHNLLLPAGQRNWDQLETMLKDVPEEDRTTAEYGLLAVDLLVLRDRLEEAAKVLQAACDKDPKEVRYWVTRAAIADRKAPAGDKPFAESLRLLDEAEKAAGDRVELRLERAGRLVRTPAESAKEAIRKLEDVPESFSPTDRVSLWVGLADAYERLDDAGNCRRLLRQAADQQPGDLRVRERLFDLALRARDDAAAQAARDEMRAIEGDDGPLWRYAEAARLVTRAEKGDRAGLAEARQLLGEVAKTRPNWSRSAVLAAEIEDLEGNVEAAIDGYRRAVELGERSPTTVHRAVQLLIARRRIEDAKQVLDQVRERVAATPDLGRDAATLSLLNKDPKERTLELADQAVAKDSKDYRDQLFRAQVLWSLDKRKEAEEVFRQAVALEPKAPEVWVALVAFLTDTDRKTQAEEEIGKAKSAIPAGEAAPALAACHEMIGQRDKAKEYHLAALQASQASPAVLRAVAAFYLRGGELKKAEPHLRQMIGNGGSPARWARRSLALSLTAGGDYQQSREALALIDDNARERRDDPEDQRVRALVLAQRPGGRRASIQALEDSFARLRPSPVEQFLLARLYEADRNWPRAKELLLSLIGGKGGDNPAYLGYYVKALLRHGGADEAAKWLRRLEEKAKDSPLAVEAKARVLAAQGKGSEAAQILREFVRKDFDTRKEVAILQAGGAVFEELKQFDEAEKFYREYVGAAEAKRPESVLVLPLFLARRNRVSEALDLCERAWGKCQPEAVARATSGVIRLGQPGDADFRRAERSLEAAIKQKPGSAALLVSLADLRDAEGRTAEAEAAYRAILAKEPRNAMALNNLAWLLAVNDGKKGEGLELIERAIEIGGPVPTRLDTRGVIRLMSGQADQGIRDLEDAAAEGPGGAIYFHLARAYLQTQNRPGAELAWEKAGELNLTEKSLHRLERDEFHRLTTELGPK